MLSLVVLFTGGDLTAGASPSGQDVASMFQDFYTQAGGVPVFGYPITGTMSENGYTVQYFERQRLEYHPELAGTGYQVLLGLVGEDAARASGLIASKALNAFSA